MHCTHRRNPFAPYAAPLLAGALLCLLAASAHAQGGLAGFKGNDRQWVEQQPAPETRLPQGKSVKVRIRFTVEPGKHINSDKPGSPLLIPTRLKLSPPTDIGIGRLTYPRGHEFSLPIAPEEKLIVFTGVFEVTALLRAARAAPQGPLRVHGELQYQACDDRACFPPKKLPVAFDVVVVRGARPAQRNPAQSPHIHR